MKIKKNKNLSLKFLFLRKSKLIIHTQKIVQSENFKIEFF